MRKARVLVTTKDDQTFRGLLWAKRGPVVVLRETSLFAGGNESKLDGEVVVERRNVSYYQRLF